MVSGTGVFKGVVRGKTIELERAVDLPEGERVTVLVQRAEEAPKLAPGEGLRRAFGSWSEDAEGVDRFVEQLRRDRDSDDRTEPTP